MEQEYGELTETDRYVYGISKFFFHLVLFVYLA